MERSKPLDVNTTSVALQRIVDEVKLGKVQDGGRYNRTYHRHNRS